MTAIQTSWNPSISIHAPTRGATAKFELQQTLDRFQSTLPRGERHFPNFYERTGYDFNPRSHEGSDIRGRPV